MGRRKQPDQPLSARTRKWDRDALDERADEIDALFRQFDVQLAYVFGSMARGREADKKAISDLDLAVVLPGGMSKSTMKDVWYELRAGLEAVFQREDFDLIIANDASTALRFRIVRDRDLFYCGSASALSRFECDTRRDWNDMQYYRQMQRRALEARYGTDDQ